MTIVNSTPVTVNPDKECLLSSGGLSLAGLAGRSDFVMMSSPDFSADERLSCCNLVLPKAGTRVPGILPTTKVSCTFRGGQCTTWNLDWQVSKAL